MHFFITGHTGFKGSWLCEMLLRSGHEVTGYGLDPVPGALFDRLNLSARIRSDIRADVRNPSALTAAVSGASPDVVMHFAAQPLVRLSYAEPRLTIDTNVMGTLSLLESLSRVSSIQAALIVTTDKVYKNANQLNGYVEEDSLGGHDPYSASKAMAEILTSSWAASFSGPLIASARAGNVIGGGDVSTDRLLPDLMRAFSQDVPAEIRFPDAVRPWQHVLDCLNGYLLLVDHLLSSSVPTGSSWNFGPDPESVRTVGAAADVAASAWGGSASWISDQASHPHEAALLTLDAGKARRELGWRDHLDFDSAIRWTVEWEKAVRAGVSVSEVTSRQLAEFQSIEG